MGEVECGEVVAGLRNSMGKFNLIAVVIFTCSKIGLKTQISFMRQNK